MHVLVLSQSDVAHLLPMRDCIDLMADALSALARGDALLPLRQVLRLPDGKSAFAVMPAYLGEPKAVGTKVITVFPENHGTALDSHQGAVLLFDAEHGSLVAIMDASSITAIRTAAVSGLATRLLARDNADDASLPFARELDTAAVVRGRLYVDRRESALNEAGDFLIPKGEGAIADDHIVGEIGELLLGRVPGRGSETEVTL